MIDSDVLVLRPWPLIIATTSSCSLTTMSDYEHDFDDEEDYDEGYDSVMDDDVSLLYFLRATWLTISRMT